MTNDTKTPFMWHGSMDDGFPFHQIYGSYALRLWRLQEVVSSEDGAAAMDQAVASGWYRCDLGPHLLLDRSKLGRDVDQYFTRLQPNINHVEYSALPEWYKPLYRWDSVREDYALRPEFLASWGIGHDHLLLGT